MRRIAIAAVLGLLSLGAVPASAADTATVMTGSVTYPGPRVVGHCLMVAVAEETVTGGQDTYTGVAVGVAVATLEAVDVRCYVRVNGGTAAVTPDGALVPGLDATAGQVTFTVSDTDVVELCMVFGLDAGIGPVCEPTTTQQVPPQEVVDSLRIPDFLVCPVLASLSPGVPGIVDITSWEGDVYVLGANVKDCPPYDHY